MKPYALMADVHLHNWSSFSTETPEGLNSRLVGLLAEIKRAATEVHAAGGNTVVIAGDLFHVRGSVAPTVLNPTRETLAEVNADLGVRFVILAGNHDLEGRDATRMSSAITALECEYVDVVNQEDYLPQLGAYLIPWIEGAEKLKAAITSFAATFTNLQELDLILHAPIDGVIEGLPAHGIDPAWLAAQGFRRVYSGHYHNHKAMAGDKVVSIGALAHHTWSDIGSKAGFLIVNGDSFQYRSTHLPQFLDLNRLVESGISDDDLELVVDGNFVRLRVDADKVSETDAARKRLQSMGAKGVLVQANPKQTQREGSVVATVSSGASLEATVAAWVKSKAGTDATLETALLTETLSVLQAADAVPA